MDEESQVGINSRRSTRDLSALQDALPQSSHPQSSPSPCRRPSTPLRPTPSSTKPSRRDRTSWRPADNAVPSLQPSAAFSDLSEHPASPATRCDSRRPVRSHPLLDAALKRRLTVDAGLAGDAKGSYGGPARERSGLVCARTGGAVSAVAVSSGLTFGGEVERARGGDARGERVRRRCERDGLARE